MKQTAQMITALLYGASISEGGVGLPVMTHLKAKEEPYHPTQFDLDRIEKAKLKRERRLNKKSLQTK